jgi:hypothetical protein
LRAAALSLCFRSTTGADGVFPAFREASAIAFLPAALILRLRVTGQLPGRWALEMPLADARAVSRDLAGLESLRRDDSGLKSAKQLFVRFALWIVSTALRMLRRA